MRFNLGVRAVLVIALLAALVVWDRTRLDMSGRILAYLEEMGPNGPLLVLVTGALVYALLLSIPFVPGVELGWCIMAVFGTSGIAVTYLATIVGLNLAFGFGRWVPRQWLPARVVRYAGSHVAQRDHSLRRLTESAGWWPRLTVGIRAALLAHPLLLLAALFNAPGNFVVGGGGGLGMLAGMTAVPWRWYLLTVVLATAPAPLLIALGLVNLEAIAGVR